MLRVTRGPEYKRVERSVDIFPDETTEVAVSLERITDLAKQGWFSGDTHVHIEQNLGLNLLAEDLHLAPVISHNKNQLPKKIRPPEKHVYRTAIDRLYTIYNWEDELYPESVIYFNLGTLTDSPPGTKLENTVDRLLETKRQQPDVWAHIGVVNLVSVPALVATGKIDSIEIVSHAFSWWMESDYRQGNPIGGWGVMPDPKQYPQTFRGRGFFHQDIYYHYLNCGFRIPPTGGTAAGVRNSPLGFCRTYVHLDGDFTNKAWWDSLAAGRVFVTDGPLLLVKANGKLPGEVFRHKDKTPFQAQLDIWVDGNDSIESVQIVRDGKVVESITGKELHGSIESHPLVFNESGWFLVRAISNVKKNFIFASTGPFYVEIGDQPRPMHREDVRFFLDWIDKYGVGQYSSEKARKFYEKLLEQIE